ncbi:MAG: SpoIIE family protein phosphatase [Nitrospirae bacterium]|nr:SpoIIE family protein phosphatase [Magnetococcales bacterium]HAT51496.1 hypothetical protein [Alphaproteobacteria bacterium]
MTTLLIVDDDPSTRMFLEAFLSFEGYHVRLAAHGQEALAILDTVACDLVLMDIQMPVLDGYQATQRIKERTRYERFLPIIFLTSVETDLELARCLECGGNDFIQKPPSTVILKARIQSWLYHAELVNKLAEDRLDVERVILKMRQDEKFDPRGLRMLVAPLEKTNGDLILSARRSDGVQYLMVGDFTGHGLAAAICGPMVADIFYRLTYQNVPLQTIISRINDSIFQRLPANMFLAAAFLELNREGKWMRVWNAALPAVLRIRSGRLAHEFPSTLPPLGIASPLAETTCEQHPLLEDDRVYLFSDGSVETRSVTGDYFGEERMIRFLEECASSQRTLESLSEVLDTFRGGREVTDDIALVEVRWMEP